MGEVIRRTKGGKFIGFYLRFYEGGQRRQMASHQPTHAEARKMLLQIEARIARGQAGMAEPTATTATVAELIERFLAEYSRPRIKDLAAYKAQAQVGLRRMLPKLGSLRADAVTAQDLARLRDSLARRYAANSVRQSFSTLGTAYNWAQRLGFVTHNPVRGLELPARVDSLDYLTADEVRRLLATAAERAGESLDDRLQYLRVLVAIHSGLRKGELLGLRWRDIDLHSGRLTIARSYASTPKSGKPRHLRLPDAVGPALAAWADVCPPSKEGLIFPVRHRSGGWGLSRQSNDLLDLPALLRASGLRVPSRPWHLLRHTFASHYMMSGGNLLALSRILGHSDVKVTMIYAHLAPDFIGAEMNRVKF